MTAKKSIKSSLLRSSACALMATTGVLGFAAASAQDAGGEEIEEVVITGSRLNANQNLVAAAPVLSIGQEEIDIRGNVRIEDLLNVLPQVFAGQAGEVSNGASGTSNLNLRGLGPNRTLVLIDGRRLPYGSSQISAANLDMVPTRLIERVDVLTGGASAVYGSDAVGGVANFILKRDFEGMELDAQGAFHQNGNNIDLFENVLRAGGQPVPGSSTDGEELFVSLTLGANTADDRGNVTLFASYETREAISQADRVISACALGADDGDQSFGGFGCVGSGNFRLFAGPNGNFFQEEDGTIIPFASGPETTFNFGPFNFFQRPTERFQIYARGHYEITENLEIFADLAYVNNSSDAQIAPTASFGLSSYNVNCDNPYLQGNAGVPLTDVYGCSAQDIADGTIVTGVGASHRNVEGGPRNSNLDNGSWRIVSGLRGDLDDTWSYEAFIQFARTQDTSMSTNDFVVANLQQAFLAVDDGNGNVVCQDPSGGCQPYNIFQRGANGESLVTQESLDFIQGVGIVNGETEQVVFGGSIQADLGTYGISSPFSEEGIGFLVGYEWREDQLDANPDEISQVPGGGFTGVGGANLPVEGAIEVSEIFAEMQIPIVTDAPLMKELTLAGQYRFSDYSTEGNGSQNSFDTDAFGIQLSYVPVDDIKLRGQFQRAVRAPNVIELFTGQDTGLPNLNSAGTNANGAQLFDPCASDAPIATLEACQRTGVTAAQYGTILDVISGQTQSITGGNTELTPESSDTWTFGVVYTPEFVPGLSISVDYFDIAVEDFIAQGVPAQVTLDNCLATGDPTFCSLIQRTANGSLNSGTFGTGFTATNLNIADLETSGIDFQLQYGTDIGDMGRLRFDFAGTWLNTYDFTPFPGGDAIECSGFFSNSCSPDGSTGNPVIPEYRHRLLATWDTPWDASVTATWRYFSNAQNLAAETAPEIDQELGTVQYLDLAVTWDVLEQVQLRGGVLNLLNHQAPVSVSSGPPLGNGNSYPTIFDTGRFVFLGARFTF